MENKINIAKLLKDCPKGMELDCTMLDNVVFEKMDVSSSHHPIIIRRTDTNKTIHLTKYGQYSDEEDYKCVIFPKGKTTWEGFVPPCKFKDGDIIVDKQGTIAIYKQVHKSYEEPCVDFHCRIYQGNKNLFHTNFLKGSLEHCGKIDSARFATEEEKRELLDVIKTNGYKWNETTKTLEKLTEPKFKAGDKVVKKEGVTIPVLITKVGEEFYSASTENSIGFFSVKDQDEWELATPAVPKFKVGDIIKNKETYKRRTITKIHQDCYECDNRYILTFENQDNWELVELKFKVGDKIRHKDSGIHCTLGKYSEGISAYRTNIGLAITSKELGQWELAPNKFDISNLKPFDKVLVRDNNEQKWTVDMFSFYDKNLIYPFVCVGHYTNQCIPYKGNEHLIGKTGDCNEYYKIWEK